MNSTGALHSTISVQVKSSAGCADVSQTALSTVSNTPKVLTTGPGPPTSSTHYPQYTKTIHRSRNGASGVLRDRNLCQNRTRLERKSSIVSLIRLSSGHECPIRVFAPLNRSTLSLRSSSFNAAISGMCEPRIATPWCSVHWHSGIVVSRKQAWQ